MTHCRWIAVALLVSLGVGGCSTISDRSVLETEPEPAVASPPARDKDVPIAPSRVTAAAKGKAETDTRAKSAAPPSPAPEKPRDQRAPSPPPATEPVRPADAGQEPAMLNLEGVSLLEFCEVVFVELLKESYAISPVLQKTPPTVSVRMAKPIAREKLLPLVSEILRQYGVFLYRKNDVYQLLSTAEAQAMEPEFRYGRGRPAAVPELGMILQIYPLNYVTTTQIDGIVRRFLSPTGSVTSHEATSSLLIVDFPERIQKILEVLDLFDNKIFEQVMFRVVRPKYWDIAGLTKALTDIMKAEGIPVFRGEGFPRGVMLLPVERLNELYLFSSKAEWLTRILDHIDRLDKAEALGGDIQTFVYFTKNTTAQDLGGVMSQILGQGSTAGTAGTGISQGGSPQAKPPAAPGAMSVSGAGQTKLIVDPLRNCLIVLASPGAWAPLRDLMEKLDLPRRQVLIEAVIGELTLDEQFQLGMDWFIKNSGVKINGRAFTGEGGTAGGVGVGSLGFLYTLVADDGLFRAAFNAFVSQNRIKIISSPRIIGVDNVEASISVGTEVPVVTSEAVTGMIQQQGTTGLLRSIQYRSTGVILRVKPTIHSNGAISLDINQELSEAQTNSISPEIQSPIILNRNFQTTLVAKSGETVFIGGLISKTLSLTTSGVPILSKIPLIGSLFKSRSKGERRTELVVMLTAHILGETTDLDYFTDSLRREILPEIRDVAVKEIKKDETP